MGNRLVIPKPWWQVGLATLPGLIALAAQTASIVGLDTRLNSLLLPTMIVLSASSILWAAVRRRLFGVAAWGLIPLGLLAAMGLYEVSGVVFSWRTPLAFFLVLTLGFGLLLISLLLMVKPRPIARILPAIGGSLALSVAVAALLVFAYDGYGNWSLPKRYSTYFVLVTVGLFLVKHSGLCAGLFVLAGGTPLMGSHIEPAVFLWDSPFWDTFSDVSLTVFFFILTPIWVLRVRSVYGQAAGLLLPIAAYFVALVSALSAARGFSIAKSASISDPALDLLATIAVAVVLYGRVSSGLTAGET